MSLKDKVTGRVKQAAGDLTGDEKLRRQGATEERKAEAKQELREAEQAATRKREELAGLDYQTASQNAARQDGTDERAAELRQDDADPEPELPGSDPPRGDPVEPRTRRIDQR